MPSVSASLGALKRQLPRGSLVAWTILVLLVLTVADSTVLAEWVPGSQSLPLIAVGGAVVVGILSFRSVPWPASLAIAAGLGLVVATRFAADALHAAHPEDRGLVSTMVAWLQRVLTGEVGGETAFFLWLLCLLFWVVGAWLAWCVLRWRQPLLGLAPAAAAFATNLLNYPAGQNAFLVYFMVLMLALLLWVGYQRSIDQARRAGMKISADTAWDFWESGVVVTAVVVMLGLFLPPISTVDHTVDAQAGVFRTWADIQQRLSHPNALGNGPAGPGNSVGFSTDVSLGGPLHRSNTVVFTYTIPADYAGPRYFRGANAVETVAGQWISPKTVTSTWVKIGKGQSPPYADQYTGQAGGSFVISMLHPPGGSPNIVFYPGRLNTVDRVVRADQSFALGQQSGTIRDIDRVTVPSASLTGRYSVSAQYSNATEAELRNAGAAFPDWAAAYSQVSDPNYRDPAVMSHIAALAARITAGATNEYDQAAAIEHYLRSGFTYTLTPPAPPTGADPLEYFLFTSKQGYCEYFATAMGDMLRSLGIPTRLVNGYGPGNYNADIHQWVVRETDAHTWVEVYFPGYGWVPFEPTADGVYQTISRGLQHSNLSCHPDCVDPNSPKPTAVASVKPGGHGTREAGPGGGGGSSGGGGIRILGLPPAQPLLAVLVVALVTLFLVLSRYLRPRTVGAVWRRTAFLSGLAGVRPEAGETPNEYGRRLGRAFPEVKDDARRLADNFVVAAYAPPSRAASSKDAVMAAWEALRPALLRRLLSRRRPATAG